MKISTKGRYALRMMIDLAEHQGDGFIALKDIAQRQNISKKYLEQIVTQLSRAGLVRSVRGAGGGYLLTREPEEYTVGEILRVLEGNLAPVSCVDQDDTCRCNRADRCVTVEVWRDIQAAVSSVVDRLTLADLVRRYHEKCPGHNV